MEFILKNLDCANCAAKIEQNVQNVVGIKNASVDFISQLLKIEFTNSADEKRITNEIEAIVKKLEPGVVVLKKISESQNILHNTSNRKKIIQIGIGTFLFFVGLIFKLPLQVEIAVFASAYLILGYDVVLKAFENMQNRQLFDENFLMTIATVAAFSIGEFAEGVAVMLFYSVGEFFQDLAVKRSRKSISSLMDMRPDFANVKIGEIIKKVSPEEVRISDIIIVKPGEKIPLDGVVIEGASLLDTAGLTGESLPRDVFVGDEVLSGSINKSGLLTIKVTKKFAESTVSKILDLVQNASSKKTETEKFITKFSKVYTPVVVLLATSFAALPPLLFDESFSVWLYRAIIFLVISCPCALVISVPLSYFSGIGAASKKGILVKGTNFLDALAHVDTVIFDKTGTLTKGNFKVSEVIAQNNFTKQELLFYAAHCEAYSNHPIALSVVSEYAKEIDKNVISDYNELTGYGTKINFNGKEILAGNKKLLFSASIPLPDSEDIGTVVHVAIDKTYAGCITIEDVVKEDSSESILSLKLEGVRNIVMLTGDNKNIAQKIADKLHIEHFFAELLPHEKIEKLELFDAKKETGKKIIFVGDGINDAPVLTRADVGIAMGGIGSEAAIEAADIVLMTDEPSKIPTAIRIAKKTRNIVWQNIIFAIGIKILVMLLGVLGMANIWEAILADVGVSLLAILNAMRILRKTSV